jgi:serine protease
MKMLAALVLSAFAAMPAFAQSTEYQGPPRSRTAPATDQIIVKWRSMPASATQRAGKLASAAGVAIQHKRSSTADTEVFKLERPMDGDELQAVLDRLNADPAVAFAVADQRRKVQRLPSDPMVVDQWYLLSVEASATHTDEAWDLTTGDPATVIAVLDTGVRPEHPDLTGKLLPGYDFVTNVAVANDGDGRDSDASDPGDWIVAADRGQAIFNNCESGASSWHGTRVSSLIGATTDVDAAGIAGGGWQTRILPVRVLGKCGGFDSDIIDGMRWAAGLPVAGVPNNPTPAKIINLSLGSDGACTAAYQQAANEVTAQGSLIIASVGNDGIPVGAPANCDNVLGVSGIRHAGTKVGYSNLGAGADIAAPAGNCVNTTIVEPTADNPAGVPCVYSLLVARDSGATVPETPTYSTRFTQANFGTSFSAPLVAAAAALVNSVNPRFTPATFTTLLQETSTCGSGMLNTAAAVTAALRPFAVVTAATTIDPNVSVNINATASFGSPGRTITAYQWSVAGVTGATPTITDTTAATTTLQVTATSRFTLRLRVTDDTGVTDDTDFAMATTQPQTPPTPIGGGGGGGGGSFDWWLLVLGLLPLALPGPRRRRAARARAQSKPRNTSSRDLQDATISASRSYRRRRRQHFPQ